MTIITQDGRRLEVNQNDGVQFEAGRYAGRESTYYVNARFAKWGKDFVKIVNICLGEYGDDEFTAEYFKKHLEESLTSGKEFVNMGATIAPADDLMASLKAVDEYYKQASPKGYCLDVGIINGKTNCSPPYGFNPDKNGSYAGALADKIGSLKVA